MEIKIPSETVRRGQRLAERQRAHLFELELTGRWRLYFKTEEEFKAKIAATSESIAQWTQLCADAADAEATDADAPGVAKETEPSAEA